MNKPSLLLQFEDGYHLSYQASGNTRNSPQDTEDKILTGGYSIVDQEGENRVIIEVVNDSVRSIFFISPEERIHQIDKVIQAFHFLDLRYKMNSAAQTHWIFFSPKDEAVLDECFTGADWRLVDGKKVLARAQKNLHQIKPIVESSIDLLHLMMYSGQEQAAIELIRNGTNDQTPCDWSRNAILSFACAQGHISLVEEILKNPEQQKRVTSLQGMLLREAARSGKKEMMDLILNSLASTKEDCLEYVLAFCIGDKDLASARLVAQYEFSINTYHLGRDSERNWEALFSMKNEELLNKVLDKSEKRHSLFLGRMKQLASDSGWKEGAEIIRARMKS